MDPVTITMASLSALNLLNQEDEKKKQSLTISQRSGVKPYQMQDNSLGTAIGLGQAGLQGYQGFTAPKTIYSKPTGGNMAPVDRALEAQNNVQAFSKAQDQLQYMTPEIQQTLGPLFADASKRYSSGRRIA